MQRAAKLTRRCCSPRSRARTLLRLKDQTPHGEFKARVQRETAIVSYDRAMRYMRVAKLVAGNNFDPTLGIKEFLASYAEEQPAKRKARPPLTREDAEYALTAPRCLGETVGRTPTVAPNAGRQTYNAL